jgi:DNA-binding NarL/FixJ family response regulator
VSKSSENKNILIIEDIDVVRDSLVQMFSDTGIFHSVHAFRSTEEVIAHLDQLNPKPDLAILDLGLPGKNGLECMIFLKSVLPHIKVLIFTVFESNDKVFDALQFGADGYLLKRESVESMLDAIEDAFNGGAPMSREIARRVLTSFRPKGESIYSDPYHLNEKEINVLELLSKGLLYKEIADEMHTTISMVKQHAHLIYNKMQVKNRTEAILKYLGK